MSDTNKNLSLADVEQFAHNALSACGVTGHNSILQFSP